MAHRRDVRVRAAAAIERAGRRQEVRVRGQVLLHDEALVVRARLHVAEATACRPVDAVVERDTDLAQRVRVAIDAALARGVVADRLRVRREIRRTNCCHIL